MWSLLWHAFLVAAPCTPLWVVIYFERRATKRYNAEARAEAEAERKPPPEVWCPKCDGLYPDKMMAWDKEGDDYLCGYCLGVPRLFGVLGVWHAWYLRRKWDINFRGPVWPGISTGGAGGITFVDLGTLNYDDVERYRGCGVQITEATNDAYEARLDERERKRRNGVRAKYDMDGDAWRATAKAVNDRRRQNLMWRAGDK